MIFISVEGKRNLHQDAGTAHHRTPLPRDGSVVDAVPFHVQEPSGAESSEASAEVAGKRSWQAAKKGVQIGTSLVFFISVEKAMHSEETLPIRALASTMTMSASPSRLICRAKRVTWPHHSCTSCGMCDDGGPCATSSKSDFAPIATRNPQPRLRDGDEDVLRSTVKPLADP